VRSRGSVLLLSLASLPACGPSPEPPSAAEAAEAPPPPVARPRPPLHARWLDHDESLEFRSEPIPPADRPAGAPPAELVRLADGDLLAKETLDWTLWPEREFASEQLYLRFTRAGGAWRATACGTWRWTGVVTVDSDGDGPFWVALDLERRLRRRRGNHFLRVFPVDPARECATLRLGLEALEGER